MATAAIIHGNDGTKTDGSGGGVDFVEEEEEKRRGERGGVEEIVGGEETISDAPWAGVTTEVAEQTTTATGFSGGWMDRKQSAGKITQRDRDRERKRPQSRPGPRRSTAGRTREGRSGAEAAEEGDSNETDVSGRANRERERCCLDKLQGGREGRKIERVNDGAEAGGGMGLSGISAISKKKKPRVRAHSSEMSTSNIESGGGVFHSQFDCMLIKNIRYNASI